MLRKAKIDVYLSKEHKKKILKRAKKLDLSVSDYMKNRTTLWGEVDEQGRLILPPEMAAKFGLQPGARFRVENGSSRIQVHRPITHLTKI